MFIGYLFKSYLELGGIIMLNMSNKKTKKVVAAVIVAILVVARNRILEFHADNHVVIIRRTQGEVAFVRSSNPLD